MEAEKFTFTNLEQFAISIAYLSTSGKTNTVVWGRTVP